MVMTVCPIFLRTVLVLPHVLATLLIIPTPFSSQSCISLDNKLNGHNKGNGIQHVGERVISLHRRTSTPQANREEKSKLLLPTKETGVISKASSSSQNPDSVGFPNNKGRGECWEM